MFKSEKQKRFVITLAIVFVVIYALLYLMIQAGYSAVSFKSLISTIFSALTPVLMGGVIAYLLNPILKLFELKILKKISRPKLRRGLSILLTYLLVLLLIVGLFAAILPQIISSIQDFGSNINNYTSAMQTAIEALFDDLNVYIDNHPSVRNLLETMRIYDWIGSIVEDDLSKIETPGDIDKEPVSSDTEAGDELENETKEETSPEESTPSTDSSETFSEADSFFSEDYENNASEKLELSFEAFSAFLMTKLQDFSDSLVETLGSLAFWLIDFGVAFLTFLKNIILGIFISIYLLFSKERVGAQFKRMLAAFLPKNASDELLRICQYSNRTLTNSIFGTLIDSTIVGLLTGLLLQFFGIKYALLIALIVGITNVIPLFGPFIGAIPSVILLFIHDISLIIEHPNEPARFSSFTFIILILIIQQIDGNIINPHVLGNTTGLSSLGVVLSIIIMSSLFGFFGMLLGVPVAAILIGIGKELTEKILAKKRLPVAVADYYAPNSPMPPETPEEEVRQHAHTALYRSLQFFLEKLRHVFRKILYRNHGKSKSLKMWVNMKLGVRSIRHKVSHTLHHEDQESSEQGKSKAAPKEPPRASAWPVENGAEAPKDTEAFEKPDTKEDAASSEFSCPSSNDKRD